MSWAAAVWLVVLLQVCMAQSDDYVVVDDGYVPGPDPDYSRADECGERWAGMQPAPITSPGYPNNYPNGANCEIVIHAEEGQQIYLEFSSFDTESNSECSFDFVRVFDGSEPETAPMLGKFCGTVSRNLISSGNAMHISFYSDGSINKQGYSAHYSISDGYEIIEVPPVLPVEDWDSTDTDDYDPDPYYPYDEETDYESASTATAGFSLLVATIAAYYLY